MLSCAFKSWILLFKIRIRSSDFCFGVSLPVNCWNWSGSISPRCCRCGASLAASTPFWIWTVMPLSTVRAKVEGTDSATKYNQDNAYNIITQNSELVKVIQWGRGGVVIYTLRAKPEGVQSLNHWFWIALPTYTMAAIQIKGFSMRKPAQQTCQVNISLVPRRLLVPTRRRASGFLIQISWHRKPKFNLHSTA